MNSSALIAEIKAAFENVQLDGGIGIRQAKVADTYGEGVTEREYALLKQQDESDKWQELTTETLDEYCFIPHLDDKGFRFYIPAFILSILADGDFSSERASSTLSALYPKQDELESYMVQRYSLFTRAQSLAAAHFLQAVANLETSEYEERKIAERAIRNYWHQYL